MGKPDLLAGQRVYLDTNVFIYALEGLSEWSQISTALFQAIDAGTCEAVTSELALCECLVKPFQMGREDIAQVYINALQSRRFFSVVPVSREVLVEAARLRSQRLTLPDAIHAATAIRTNCRCFLTNDDRFRSVKAIQVAKLNGLAGS